MGEGLAMVSRKRDLIKNDLNVQAVEEQQAKIMGQVRAGAYLKQLRSERELSLADLGKELGVSSAYLSNIEQGVKSMSDYFAREIAQFFQVDENIIFELLGRVPLLAKEELEDESNLQKLIIEIRQDPKLDDEKKQKLYDQMYKLYKNFPE
jgi:transcriptional regulator with XRE-family HTH domain